MRYVEKPLYTGESVLIPRKGTLNNIMYVNEAFLVGRHHVLYRDAAS